nr:hypothetical protein [bacterium]
LRQITGTIRTGVPLVPPAETGSGTACFLNPPVAVVTEPILGGCLSILSTLSGTPWEPADQAFILFLEDIGEAPYRIDRMLTHMIHTRWIRSCRGIVLGDFIACDQRPDDPEPTPTVTEVLRERLQHLSLPVLKGFPVGHGVHNFTIPLGIPFSIRGDTLIQEESGVESLRRG